MTHQIKSKDLIAKYMQGSVVMTVHHVSRQTSSLVVLEQHSIIHNVTKFEGYRHNDLFVVGEKPL